MKLLVALLLVSFCTSSIGIKCYQCSHSDAPASGIPSDPGCRDADETHLHDCNSIGQIPLSRLPLKANTTVKVEKQINIYSCAAYVKYVGQTVTDIIRDCAPYEGDNYTVIPGPIVIETYSICNRDGCNTDGRPTQISTSSTTESSTPENPSRPRLALVLSTLLYITSKMCFEILYH